MRVLVKKWRKWQTPVLAVSCFVCFVSAAVFSFEVPAQLLLQLFALCLLVLLVIMSLAAVTAWCWRYLKQRRAD